MNTTIAIEGEFPTLNEYIDAERGNLYQAAKIKILQTNRVRYEAQSIAPIEKYPVFISIHWLRKNRRSDPDNVAFAKKFILDGLVLAGVLKGDGWKYIRGFADTFDLNAKEPGVIIQIQEAGKDG